MNLSILIVRPLLDVVASYGVSRDRLFSAASFDPARLDDVDGRLELAELDRLQEAALEVTSDPALGIHMGEQANATAYDIIGYIGTHGSTLRETIESLIRYSRIFSDLEPRLEEAEDVATLVIGFTGRPDEPARRLRVELAATGFVRLIRPFSDDHGALREVLFQHAAPPYRAEYERFFGGIERFDQPITGLRFDRALLSREAVHKNPRLSAIFTSEAERMLHRLERRATYAERLRELLVSQRVDATPTMSDLADRLGVSVRSLRRRLAEEGVSFPKLLEEAHLAFAKRLLEDPHRSLYQVAFDMGFSDPSAFHRAFRRWTGMTPMAYRANLG